MEDGKAEVTRKVIELAADQGGVDPSNVRPETHFVHDLQYDSLDLVEFTMKLEDEFELSVSDDEAQQLQTVAQVIERVLSQTSARQANPT